MWGAMAESNSRVLKTIAVVSGVLGLVYFGMTVGQTSERVTKLEGRVAEEVQRAPQSHAEIEARTDQKVTALRELILAEFRALDKRLERMERRLQ